MAQFSSSTIESPAREMASVGVGACMFALSRGVSLEAVLEATGLRADTLTSPGVWVSQSVVLGLWALLVEALPGRLPALELAEFASQLMLGDLGRAARFAPDLGTALHLVSRNSAILGDGIRVDVIKGPVETEFRMHHPSDEVDGGHGAQLGLAVAVRAGIEVFGRSLAHRVEFRHQPLAPVDVYTEFFRVPVHFGRPNNALVIATSDLTTPNPGAEPGLDVMARRWLDRLLEERGIGTVSEGEHRIRAAMLTNAKRGDFTTAGLARTLGMSLRTLRRQFTPADVQPQTVLEDLRRNYATEFLKDTSLSIEEIAERLGYADERSFRRAFQRWTGMSPAQARRAE